MTCFLLNLTRTFLAAILRENTFLFSIFHGSTSYIFDLKYFDCAVKTKYAWEIFLIHFEWHIGVDLKCTFTMCLQ